MTNLTAEQAAEIRERLVAKRAWLDARKGNSYRQDELIAAGLSPVSNSEVSALEVFEFMRDKPDDYFLYINAKTRLATTWTGDKLGDVTFGSTWHDNFGGKRTHVTIRAINGETYSGTYFTSSGDYARVRKIKGRKA